MYETRDNSSNVQRAVDEVIRDDQEHGAATARAHLLREVQALRREQGAFAANRFSEAFNERLTERQGSISFRDLTQLVLTVGPTGEDRAPAPSRQATPASRAEQPQPGGAESRKDARSERASQREIAVPGASSSNPIDWRSASSAQLQARMAQAGQEVAQERMARGAKGGNCANGFHEAFLRAFGIDLPRQNKAVQYVGVLNQVPFLARVDASEPCYPGDIEVLIPARSGKPPHVGSIGPDGGDHSDISRGYFSRAGYTVVRYRPVTVSS